MSDEILKKIKELSDNEDNFFREWPDEVPPTFDSEKTEQTFRRFAEFILSNERMDTNISGKAILPG